MADSSSSQQSQLSQPSNAHPRANRGKKKSLVHASVFSLRDLLSDFGEAFPNLLHLESYQFPSKYDQEAVDTLAVAFGINGPYRAVAPGPNDRSCYPKPGALRIYKETLYAGFRFPPPMFVCRLLAEAHVCPTQLQPNGWKFIYCFLVQCRKHNLEPSVAVFRYLFKFVNAPHDEGWVKIQYRNLARSIFVSDSAPDSLPLWKKQWFYVFMEGASWEDCFYSNFSRAEDGPVRSLKSGLEEEAAIRILTGDNLHHCSLLISEASLQAHGLSDLGPKGTPLILVFLYSYLSLVMGLNPFFHILCSFGDFGQHIQEKGGPCLQGRPSREGPYQAAQEGRRP